MHPLESHFNHSKSVVDIVDVEVSVSSVAAPYFIPSTLSAIIFSCIVYHDMNAKNTIVIFLRQDFSIQLFHRPHAHGSLKSLKFDDIVWTSFFSNFRMSINDTWDRNVIQMPRFPNIFQQLQSFVFSPMSQHRTSNHITTRIDTGNRSLEIIIDLNPSLEYPYSQPFINGRRPVATRTTLRFILVSFPPFGSLSHYLHSLRSRSQFLELETLFRKCFCPFST